MHHASLSCWCLQTRKDLSISWRNCNQITSSLKILINSCTPLSMQTDHWSSVSDTNESPVITSSRLTKVSWALLISNLAHHFMFRNKLADHRIVYAQSSPYSMTWHSIVAGILTIDILLWNKKFAVSSFKFTTYRTVKTAFLNFLTNAWCFHSVQNIYIFIVKATNPSITKLEWGNQKLQCLWCYVYYYYEYYMRCIYCLVWGIFPISWTANTQAVGLESWGTCRAQVWSCTLLIGIFTEHFIFC